MKMRAALITIGSIALTVSVIGNAYFQKKQFYPSVVYITKSNPSMAIIYLQAFVFVLLMGKLMRKIFFGQLRTAEMEHLIERSWYAVTETCLAFTVFRDDLSPKFVALFTLLLFLKCFHWLAEDRVDYMERSPNISLLFHVRVISLLSLLGSLDFIFVHLAYYSTLTKGASVQLVFGFEYAILFAVVLNIVMKYALHFVDLQSENPWEDKAVYLLYTELIMGFLKVVLYLTFITIMMKIHTFPLFAIRPMYLSMRAFKKALNDVIMSRRAIRNMNTLYPNATQEELRSMDNICIICREEMTGNGSAKKLPCNHIFHVSCLRSWFQRQQTCPTCRMDVLRAPAATRVTPPVAQPIPQPAAAIIPPHLLLPAHWQQLFAVPPQQQQPQAPQQTPQAPPAQNAVQNPIQNLIQNQMQNPLQNPVDNNNQPSTSADSTTANVTSQPQAFASTLPMPFMAMPPFMPMPFMPTMSMPQPDLSTLSMEQLRAMEGNERANVESRIRVIRNVQALLDAAVLQLQQYQSVLSYLPANDGASVPPSTSTAGSQPSESRAGPSQGAAAPGTSNANAGPSNAAPSGAPADPKEVVRIRRLQRFSQTTPPVIDSTGSAVAPDTSQPSTSQAAVSSDSSSVKKDK